MANHSTVQFRREINKLFGKRIHWLLRAVGGTSTKKPPYFNRTVVDTAITRLQDIASDCIAEGRARTEFYKIVVLKKQWHVKGFGLPKKKALFSQWFSRHIAKSNYIYIFWGKNGKCLYVGKTEKGEGRPEDHFNKRWFPKARRIDIHAVTSRTQVLKIECLAKHRLKPKYNKIDPPTRKWYKKCPVCLVHSNIRDQMRRIFGLKKA
ncbi:MAG: GIY-YIG nuclease family protein [Chloroflexi bacterium]|nr:GIY-YIG nuclease family protein [Chloroflexota bacterium]